MSRSIRKGVLITGGAGFIGSHFVRYFIERYPEYRVVVLDLLTYAGDVSLIQGALEDDRGVFVRGDISDEGLVHNLFEEYDIRMVVHFAAETHVDNSIASPEAFVQTNVMGTFRLLQEAREYWMSGVGTLREGYEDVRFHHISTDEVYGSLESADPPFSEDSPYRPSSPYSASKASSDFFVQAYGRTYGLPVTISHCSNNYGPDQHDEKLIPTIIRHALAEEAIPIYGSGRNVRDWLYVDDHCRAVDLILHRGHPGDSYAIGGDNEWENIAIAREICTLLDDLCPRPSETSGGSYADLITFVSDRPGHDWRYALDASKLRNELGWKPEINFREGLLNTIESYRAKYRKPSKDSPLDTRNPLDANTRKQAPS